MGLSRVCRGGHCFGAGRTRISRYTNQKFQKWQDAEKYVAKATGGQQGVKEPVGDTTRKIDVSVDEKLGPTAVEVKTGRQALTSRIKQEIAGDVALQDRGYQTVWEFYPNGKGVTGPSQNLLDALNNAGIDVNIYLPHPVDFPISLPGDEPVPILPPEEIPGCPCDAIGSDGGGASGGDDVPPDG